MSLKRWRTSVLTEVRRTILSTINEFLVSKSRAANKLGNLTKYFSKPKEGSFNTFVKDHDIDDRDLVVSSRIIHQDMEELDENDDYSKKEVQNKYSIQQSEDSSPKATSIDYFNKSIENNGVEKEEIEQIMVSGDSIFNTSNMNTVINAPKINHTSGDKPRTMRKSKNYSKESEE